jgi:hypothetical protein
MPSHAFLFESTGEAGSVRYAGSSFGLPMLSLLSDTVRFSAASRNFADSSLVFSSTRWRRTMHGIIYLIGLIVVIMAILSFFGLR